jgi:predicted nucleic acid-binding protein
VADLLVDSDVFVDHLRGARPLNRGRDTVHYSTVTLCELFAGRSADESVIRHLLRPFRLHPVNAPVAMRAGRLLRRHPLGTADALIAATALEHELVLLTRNLKDFGSVRGLKVRSPG